MAIGDLTEGRSRLQVARSSGGALQRSPGLGRGFKPPPLPQERRCETPAEHVVEKLVSGAVAEKGNRDPPRGPSNTCRPGSGLREPRQDGGGGAPMANSWELSFRGGPAAAEQAESRVVK